MNTQPTVNISEHTTYTECTLGLFLAFGLICVTTKMALFQVMICIAQSFPVFIIATCRKPGLENFVPCKATRYLWTGFATIQSIVDLAFIQVLMDFQQLNMLFLNC